MEFRTTPKSLIIALRPKLKQASLLYLHGFLDACCLHRVAILCYRSRKLLFRTGQCFLLNGFIFLGSILVLYKVIIPTLGWILPHQLFGSTRCIYSALFLALSGLFSIFPVTFIMHFVVNAQSTTVLSGQCDCMLGTDNEIVCWVLPYYYAYCLPLYLAELVHRLVSEYRLLLVVHQVYRYNDIAKLSFAAMGRSGQPSTEPSGQNEALTSENSSRKPVDLGGVMIGIGEQLYSMVPLTSFLLEVYSTGLIPYVGKALNSLLLTWMYAYYCFEYKWNFYKVALDRRLDFFESNWAFFAGFGSPCVLAISFFSPFVGYGVMAILFPLFVLTATGSGADDLVLSQRKTWSDAGLGRLPIFYVADTLSMRIVSYPFGSSKR